MIPEFSHSVVNLINHPCVFKVNSVSAIKVGSLKAVLNISTLMTQIGFFNEILSLAVGLKNKKSPMVMLTRLSNQSSSVVYQRPKAYWK